MQSNAIGIISPALMPVGEYIFWRGYMYDYHGKELGHIPDYDDGQFDERNIWYDRYYVSGDDFIDLYHLNVETKAKAE
jgi:hypothetical protein